jgi:hypothetical protein
MSRKNNQKKNDVECFFKMVVDHTTSAVHPGKNGWGLKVADYFTPFNQAKLSKADQDLAGGGVVILPDSVGSGMVATSSVTVTVVQTLTSLSVTPGNVTLANGESRPRRALVFGPAALIRSPLPPAPISC